MRPIPPVARIHAHSSGALFLVLLLAAANAAPGSEPARLLGFDAESSARQRELERRMDALLDADALLEWNAHLTRRPHHAGSPQGHANAQWMRDRFREWGYDVQIETFHVLIPSPTLRKLELLEPVRYTARLREEAVGRDATSKLAAATGLPPYNVYSAQGDVTAELVYVNYGVPDDYEALERLGIGVRGKIVLARYGKSWRGIKPKLAASKGAIGCILYSDPHDDGYFKGDAYPDGPFKHSTGVQRGSVLDLPLRPGDPLTPMRGAVENAERLDRSQAETLMRIPVLPISWGDAQPLLAALKGPVAPFAWRGSLPMTYRVGPGPAKVRLQLAFEWKLVPVHNVIARLPGAELPDQWIIRGNHHDAWVTGARDPISGLIALLAEAKAVGTLAQAGWRPRRTLVYAAWDAEEPGLLGSTEWAEHHAAELREKAAVYINSDGNSRGLLTVGGSHALQGLINEVAAAVKDPQTDVSVGERLRAATAMNSDELEAVRVLQGGELRIDALGSGSDYTPFLHHLGVASLDVAFRGEADGGNYHTAFDTHDFYRRFVDPGAAYGVALAKFAGRVTLRLAEARVLPFDYRTTADTVQRYIDELQGVVSAERTRVELHNQRVQRNAFRLAADPKEPYVPPGSRLAPPHLNWAPLLNAADALEKAATTQAASLRAVAEGSVELPPATATEVDRLLYLGERLLTREEGLPGRPWYRHHVYAPGLNTGYSVKTLPGVREAIEEERWDEVGEHIAAIARLLEALARQLLTAAEEVGSASNAACRAANDVAKCADALDRRFHHVPDAEEPSG